MGEIILKILIEITLASLVLAAALSALAWAACRILIAVVRKIRGQAEPLEMYCLKTGEPCIYPDWNEGTCAGCPELEEGDNADRTY